MLAHRPQAILIFNGADTFKVSTSYDDKIASSNLMVWVSLEDPAEGVDSKTAHAPRKLNLRHDISLLGYEKA